MLNKYAIMADLTLNLTNPNQIIHQNKCIVVPNKFGNFTTFDQSNPLLKSLTKYHVRYTYHTSSHRTRGQNG
jgi:hypothetical protein